MNREGRNSGIGRQESLAELTQSQHLDLGAGGKNETDFIKTTTGLDPATPGQQYPIAARFTDLGLDLLGTQDLKLAVQSVIHAAGHILEGVDFASLTVSSGNGFSTPAYTDSTAIELDLTQYQANDGPCVEAIHTPGLGLAFCSDLAIDPPWPVFATHAVKLGVHSVLSVALFPTAQAPRLGALNFYARTPGALDGADRNMAIILAAYAGTALAAASALETSEQHVEHLQHALETRDMIGQAKGILMQRRGLSAQEAFNVLSDASQRLNIKVRDLAQTLSTNPAFDLPQ